MYIYISTSVSISFSISNIQHVYLHMCSIGVNDSKALPSGSGAQPCPPQGAKEVPIVGDVIDELEEPQSPSTPLYRLGLVLGPIRISVSTSASTSISLSLSISTAILK